MASPQCENGYTKIANEIMESLARIRIPGEARQVFDVILRKTYGYNKKEDAISLSQFCLATGITKPNVCAALKKLKEMNLITQNHNAIANVYSINKDYSQWKPLPKKITQLPKTIMKNEKTQQKQGIEGNEIITQNHNDREIITQNHNASLPKTLPTKEIYTKENNIYSRESIEYRLSELLFSLIRERDEKYRQPNLQSWSSEIEKLIRIDKRTPEEIESVIKWCQKDLFWQNNILSTKKLREKFSQLKLKMESLAQHTKNCAICGTTTAKDYLKSEKGLLCRFCYINRQGVVL